VQSALDMVNSELPHYRSGAGFTILAESFTPEKRLAHGDGENSHGMPSMQSTAKRLSRCTANKLRRRAERMSKRRTSRNAVKEFSRRGAALGMRDAVVELTLDFEPLNEIGTVMLADLE